MLLRRISILFVLFLYATGLAAQPNRYNQSYIQNHYFAETGGGELNWGIVQDKRGIIYVANNDNGILEYDGSSWRSYPVPGIAAVRSVVAGDDGYIYAGLDGDFGRLEPDLKGSLHYRSLLDSIQRQTYSGVAFWRTYYESDKVYSCGMQAIIVFDVATNEISVIVPPENTFLSFFVGSRIYTSTPDKGVLKYNGDEFVPLKGGEKFRGKSISGLIPLDTGRLLASTFSQRMYILDTVHGTVDSTFMRPELMEEIEAARVIFMQSLNGDIYLGTRERGLIILNDRFEVKERISENEGLLGNAIPYFIFENGPSGNHALWIALWGGISRVDINSPFRSVSVGQSNRGMYGRDRGELITDVVQFGGDLFVSTQGGLQQHQHDGEEMRFRPVRGIRSEVNDLQVVEPTPGVSMMLAVSNRRTFVIDRNMQITTIPVGGRKILADRNNPEIFYTGNDHLKAFKYMKGQWTEVLDEETGSEIFGLCQDSYDLIWISTRRGLIRMELVENQKPELQYVGADEGLPSGPVELFTDPENQELIVGTNEGFYYYDYTTETLLYDSLFNSVLPAGRNNIRTVYRGMDGLYWFSFENENSGWNILAARRTNTGFQMVYERLFRNLNRRVSTDVFFTDPERQLWFSKANELILFDESRANETEDTFEVLMRNVKINGDSVVFDGTYYTKNARGQLVPDLRQTSETQPRLKHLYRNIEFQWSAPYYQNERQTMYTYHLAGFSENWSEWSRERTTKYTNLPYGKYEMQVKARNAYGDESPVTTYTFSILRPWYTTFAALLLYFILIFSLVVFVILYTRKLRSRAELLEKQNKEIEHQKKELEHLNEEITSQRDEIERQRDSMSEQNELIDRQNIAFTDSILYAKKIQDAVLPASEVMRYLLPKHFVFYQPRDIVSGDFYWVDKRDEIVLVAVADCTGHGVPGAFLSMLGISLLNEISSKFTDNPTNEIIDELRDRLIAALGQTGDIYETKDGMEMSLVAINTNTREVQYTGANHNLYTFQKGELVVIKGDPMPVGIHSESSTLFSSTTIRLNRGDTLYMLSDGIIDQFGGKNRKKYGTQRFKTLLAQMQKSIMLDQKTTLEKAYANWKADHEQIDDVLVIGIKL